MEVQTSGGAVVVVLKDGVDEPKWIEEFKAMVRGDHLEEPDAELENRSYVLDCIQEII
jgi:hypothetical protein